MVDKSPTHWLMVISGDNFAVAKDNMMFGVSQKWRKLLSEIEPHDPTLIYLSKAKAHINSVSISSFKAVVWFTGPVEQIDNAPWNTPRDRSFPYCRRVSKILDSEKALKVQPHLEKLRFIGSTKGWSAYFLRTIQRIPAEDFNYVVKRLRLGI